MRKHTLNLLIVSVLLISISIGCNLRSDVDQTENAVVVDKEINVGEFKRIDGYELKGQRFAFYRIPNGLDQKTLVEIARAIHKGENDAQLILVDDEARVNEYIDYVKAFSAGNSNKELPKDWADAHIVANVQRYINGRWVLCKGYGFEEIADLK